MQLKYYYISAGRNLRYLFLSCANKSTKKFRHLRTILYTGSSIYVNISAYHMDNIVSSKSLTNLKTALAPLGHPHFFVVNYYCFYYLFGAGHQTV
jgi:hypothetical protein